MMKHLFLLLIALLLVGCKSTKVIESPTVIKDSVHVEIRERVVTVSDTLILEVPAQRSERQTQDSVSHLETKFASSDAEILPDGSLFHSLRNKSQRKPIPTQSKVIYRDSTVYVNKPVPYPVERKLSGWEQLKIDHGGQALVLLALLIFLWGLRITTKYIIKRP